MYLLHSVALQPEVNCILLLSTYIPHWLGMLKLNVADHD